MKLNDNIEFLGIRHHGPGCARHLKEYLESYQPSIILIEGPQNAQKLLDEMVIHEIRPPASILLFRQGHQQNTYILPFAIFSPEWIAIKYAKENNVPVEFIDLPLGYYPVKEDTQAKSTSHSYPLKNTEEAFAYLSKLQGIEDVEQWWEINFEVVNNQLNYFERISELIDTIQPAIDRGSTHHTKVREAWMRLQIRKSIKNGENKTAVICGAAHLPFLRNFTNYSVLEDKELIKLKSKLDLTCSWIPWSYKRLSSLNNYSAGVQFPLFYEHIYRYGSSAPITITAALSIYMRKAGYDISLAHTLEAVNLSQTLASLRGFDMPGINEIMEACKSVYNIESKISMSQLIHEAFIGNDQGEVPVNLNEQALIADFRATVKECKFEKYIKDNAEYEVVLDLRNEKSLLASQLIWKMSLLGIDWGIPSEPFKSTKGTFNEYWTLQWNTEFLIFLFHQCIYGTNINQAVIEKIKEKLNAEDSPTQLTLLMKPIINAQIPELTNLFLQKIENNIFQTHEINQWLQLMPTLISFAKYGSVRNLGNADITELIEKLTTRIAINLEESMIALPKEEVVDFTDLLVKFDAALRLLNNDLIFKNWTISLFKLSENNRIPSLLRGWLVGISLENKFLSHEEAFTIMAYELSDLDGIENAAQWLDGILSTQVFSVFEVPKIIDIINEWLKVIDFEKFREVLPGLRKAFSKMSEAMKSSFKSYSKSSASPGFNFKNEEMINKDLKAFFQTYINQLIGVKP
ncbi:MAG: hypothetical protein KA802_16210 [Saprospiraceae bacterium]|nr:hypothetical protein [Saprospiraceae bacterium]MBP9126920.1 hypothetical protein [Saprospiraceae bacterium]